MDNWKKNIQDTEYRRWRDLMIELGLYDTWLDEGGEEFPSIFDGL